jgi:hypothetical protein
MKLKMMNRRAGWVVVRRRGHIARVLRRLRGRTITALQSLFAAIRM